MDLTRPRFGRYEIEKELGHGAMGIVYLAHDPVIDRPVAIKTLKLDLSDAELVNFRQRFLQEARLAGKLNHPNIVTIYDVGQADDTAYIAMEYLEGKELREVLAEGNKFTFREIAEIVAEIADAVAYAHANGIIHRDIKPANIMLVRDNVPKVLDFGIAQLPAGTRTLTGAVIGSPKYMSPEQVQGKALDGRSDLFSLGTVMYEMLTKRVPFEGETLASVVYQILHEMPAPPQLVSNNTPTYLARIVGKVLSKNPDDRYQRADDMAYELRQYVMKAQAKATIGKKTSADEFPSLTTGTDADGTAKTVQLSQEEIAALASEEKEKPRAKTGVVLAGIGVVIIASAALAWWFIETARPPAQTPIVATTPPVTKTVPVEPSQVEAKLKVEGDEKTNSSTSASTPVVDIPTAPVPVATNSSVDSSALKSPDPADAKKKELKIDPKTDAKDKKDKTTLAKIATSTDKVPGKDTPTPALPTKGTVVLAVTPWGEVYVDGRKIGVSPPLTELQLTLGNHKIEIRNGDSEPYTATVEVTATEPRRIKHKF